MEELRSDLEWMCRFVEVLYRVDERGRLLAVRESPGADRPAPRFLLGRTRHGNVWRFRSDLDRDTVRELARLAGREPPLAAAASGPPERLEPMRRVLGAAGPIQSERCSVVLRARDGNFYSGSRDDPATDASRRMGLVDVGELWQLC